MPKRKDTCAEHPDSPRIPRGYGETGRTRCAACFKNMHQRSALKRATDPRYRYNLAKVHAKIVGKEFTLTLPEYSALISLPCVYRISAADDQKIGLDRRDNTKGYTLENSLSCCSLHNTMRNRFFTYEQTLEIVQRYQIHCGSMGSGARKK